MATIVYVLSAILCFSCALLLMRSFKRGGNRLLLWSGICFVGLMLNNVLATIDVNTATDLVDLSTIRLLIGIMSVSILVYGLIWEST